MVIFNDEIPQRWDLVVGSKTNLTFIKKKDTIVRRYRKIYLKKSLQSSPKVRITRWRITSADFISNRPSFSCAEPFCDTFVSHRSAPLSFPSNVWTKSVAAEDKQAGGKQAIVAHGNPWPCFLGRLHPGLRLFPESIVFAKYDRGRNENYTSSPLPFSRQSRNALFPPSAASFSPFRAVLHLSALPFFRESDGEVVCLYAEPWKSVPWTWRKKDLGDRRK